LVHLDLYRLEKKEELKALDLPRVINNKNNLIMIEWPENVGVEVDEQINFRALEEGVIVIQFCYAQF
jgi:tRNA A37 threonylcarbamoyladenosine biosynthesis protein TsaE